MSRVLLTAALLASAAVGVVIILTDAELWDAAPSHAYALMGFVALDILVAGLAFGLRKPGSRLAIVWALAKFFLMLGDIITARDVGFQDYTQFMQYLFTLWTFDALLIIQLIIAVLAYRALQTKSPGAPR